MEYGLLAAKTVDAPFPENTTLNHIGSDDDKILSFPVIGVQISENCILKLIAYADSNWARCHVNRKSVSEAEYRSMASATCEGDYGVAGDDYKGPPIFDDDQYEEESMPICDTDIEDVIEEEE
ncbi:hypothetical protein Tco_1209064 [Tanacetum coccineum]